MPKKPKILFLCTGNACRSQMAEAWTKHLWGRRFEPFSAGIEPKGLDPRALKVMAEAGLDISSQRSKHLRNFEGQEFDYVVSVCARARRECPFFPARLKRLHASFDDPSQLAKNAKSEEEALAPYRRIRDEIKAFVERLPEILRSAR